MKHNVIFSFLNYMTFLYFTLYGMMTISIKPNYQLASIVAATLYSLFNLFSRFFIPKPACNPLHQVFSLNKLLSISTKQQQPTEKNSMQNVTVFHLHLLLMGIIFGAKHLKMVDLVLLDMPCFMDYLWSNFRTVSWRCHISIGSDW